MKSTTKVRLIVASYCVGLWLTNWSFSTSYDRNVGLTSQSLDLRGLGAVVGGLVTFVCVRRLWHLIRELLALGVRIPRDARICGDWGLLWLLAPLAFGVSNRSTGLTNDGTLATTIFQYGGDWPSILSIGLSASAIMLFQTVVHLESNHPDKEQNNAMNRSRGVAVFHN